MADIAPPRDLSYSGSPQEGFMRTMRVLTGLAMAMAMARPGGAQTAAPATGDPALLKKSCDKGNVADCYTLASMHRRGEGAPRDPSRAAGFLKKACEGGHSRACLDLAAMHRAGEGVSRDVNRSVVLLKKACDLREGDGCL